MVVKSGVVKSGKISIKKPVKIWDQRNLDVISKVSLNQVTKRRWTTVFPLFSGWNFRVELGIYYVFLQDWFSQFPREQIFVLRLEDLSSRPNQIMKMVFQFLGVSLKGWKMPTKTNANRNPNNIGPMKNETKLLLTKFYAEFNDQLVYLLGDTRFY